MITTKLEWHNYKEEKPQYGVDILFRDNKNEIHSGYFINNEFVEPLGDCEQLFRWSEKEIVMWTYFPQISDFRIKVTYEWRAYRKEISEPYDYQEVLFVDDSLNGYPEVFCGYYNASQYTFIDYAHNFKFAATPSYWMPLPKPPQEYKDEMD